jgi:pilus assembly protein CpaD
LKRLFVPKCRTSPWGVGIGLTSVLAVLGAGCDSLPFDEKPTKPIEASLLHPIGAELQTATLDVPAGLGAHQVSTETFTELTRFARQYGRDGRGPIFVSVPKGTGNRQAGDLAALSKLFRSNGIADERVKIRHVGGPTIRLSYDRIAAVAPPDCRSWPRDLGERPGSGPYENFGCASQRNLANMVADPLDLAVPANETSRPGDRRAATYQAYKGTSAGGGGGDAAAGGGAAAGGAGAGASGGAGK